MTTTLQTAPQHAAPERETFARPGLVRLTTVELRKLADTRAGMWLLIVIGFAALATSTIMLIWAPDDEQTMNSFFQFGLAPASFMLPVLGILSMTGEWSQRTALTTFTLVPARGRVVAAKVFAGVLIAIASTGAALALAAVGELIAGGHHWDLTAGLIGQAVVAQIAYMLVGLGFGALLMNSPVAIVVYLVLPTLWSILGATIKSLNDIAGWLDLNTASVPLTETGVTSGEWARFGVAIAFWGGLTLVLGTIRVLRREVS